VNQSDGRILHGEIAICGSLIMIGDPDDSGLCGEPRAPGRCSADLHIFVDDNEALLRRAIGDRRRRVISIHIANPNET
jgi:PhnB protein